ncbi:hypothetical protein FHETE_514 [Fusarium heterosporum]|uniref:Uncharacterized protein n=1 Tax=Fusarium heterosporum TaxID=42747 RepID=A0A8H5X453_FUSHE|nr:hypothetical protein FHETE_514 [Fusarium heterosporum]
MAPPENPRNPKVVDEDAEGEYIEEAPVLSFNDFGHLATNTMSPGPFFSPPYYQPNFNTPGQGFIDHHLSPYEQQPPPGFSHPNLDSIGLPHQQQLLPTPAQSAQGFIVNTRRPYQQPPLGAERMSRYGSFMIDPDTGGPIIDINPDIDFTDPWKPSANPRSIPRRDSNVSPKTILTPIHVSYDQDTPSDSSQRQSRSQAQEQPFQQGQAEPQQDLFKSPLNEAAGSRTYDLVKSSPSQASNPQSSRQDASARSQSWDSRTPQTVLSANIAPATPPPIARLHSSLEITFGLLPNDLSSSQGAMPNKSSEAHLDI